MTELYSGLHRTDDWPRLRNSGFVQVGDYPGRIVIHREKAGRAQIDTCKALFLAAVVFGLTPAINGHYVTAIFSGMAMALFGGLIFGMVILSIKSRMRRYADTVIFTPTDVEFFSGKTCFGSLPRQGMQQIVADKDHHGLRHHRFIADVGYISAFPTQGATDHLIVNNILMSAFGQPLHLDGMEGPTHETDAPAPQVVGLSAIR